MSCAKRWALFALCISTIGATASAVARPLELDDLYAIRDVSDARISPDGQHVVYTVTAIDRERDETISNLWMVSWDGGDATQLTYSSASESAPRWSPDGRRIGFLSDRADEDKGEQVWVLDLAGGEARQISTLDFAVAEFAWAPDGTRMALVASVDPTPADDGKPEPIVIDRHYFKEDGAGYLRDERQQLFLLDVETGDATRLTDDEFDNKEIAWSPDGTQIAFVSKRGSDPDRHANWDVFVMDAAVGAEATAVTDNPGSDDASWGGVPPAWSPDGSRIAYEHGGAPEDIWYGLRQVGIVGLDDAEGALPVHDIDRNAYQPRWSPNGRSVLLLLEDDQSVQLARVRLRDSRIERLTPEREVVSDFDVAANGRIVVLAGSATQPNAIWKLDRGRLVKLTSHNDELLAEVDLRPAETIAFDSTDGLEIHGIVLRPVEEQAPYPTVVRIHGGPVSQFQHEFNFEWQLLAANGYLVVGTNPRGSSGRGLAFQKMLFADWGHADVPDVLAAVDYLVENGDADPARLGVGGWSYGGILTNYVIASTDRFKAATSGSSMSNMLGGYGIDQYVRDWEMELGKPWEATELWLRLSYPFLEADRISTPTLFLCGAADFNVPLAASEQMYQALQSVGVETTLVIYPEEYHSLARPSFRLDRLRRYLEWYERYLGKAASHEE